jgi:CBS domain-containing protein
MRENRVGDHLVVDQQNGVRTPVGIVTDRDIVIAVVAPGLDPAILSVGEVVQLLADEMTEVAKLISREQRREMATRK